MEILKQIIEVLIPPAASFLAVQALKLSGWVDSLPAIAKQLLAVVVSMGLAALGGALQLPLPSGLSGLTADVVAGILSALAAMGFHSIYKGAKASTAKR